MKANHNVLGVSHPAIGTVSYGSKILKWKQITTAMMRVNHPGVLFPMVQRY